MKGRGPCRIDGVRLGELRLDNTSSEYRKLEAHFILEREDGAGVGKYTKIRWSIEVAQALEALVRVLEAEAAGELFDEPPAETIEEPESQELEFPTVPTIGGPPRRRPSQP